MFFLGRFMVSATGWAEAPATSRHTRRPLWLLPSGPDQVHRLVLREDQGLHRFCVSALLKVVGLLTIAPTIARANPEFFSKSRSTD